MTVCYPNNKMSYSNLQALPHYHQLQRTASTRLVARPQSQQQQQPRTQPQKDYSTPLHVDCSVEYELPERYSATAATRSKGSSANGERLLMVHPCYFRKLELHRRSPFVNNMPVVASTHPSNRRSKVLAPAKNTIVVPTSAKNNSKHSMNASLMTSDPNHVEQQMLQTPCQSAQIWRNQYVQRQMNSQQAQYPMEQPERQQHDWGYTMGLNGSSKRYIRDEKTAVVAIPRSGQESIPIQSAKISVAPLNNDNVRLYRGPVIQKADRDPILTSGCVYQVTNGNFNSMWEPIQKSPAIPFSAYQVGLDSKVNQSSAANNFASMTRHSLSETSVIRRCNEELTDTNLSIPAVLHNSHYQPVQHYRNEKSTHNPNANNKVVVKCRQRWAPYSLDNITAPLAGPILAPYFPSDPFPKIQQVSCYNV